MRLNGAVIADESFIHFNHSAIAAEGSKPTLAHGLTDAMPHEPSGFEGDA